VADRNITISGAEFTIPQPFAAGHVCSEGDAKALNQTFAEAIRNNLASRVKKGEAGQADVTEYANAFVFTIASAASAAKLTPVEREARNLARNAIKASLDGQGRKIGDVDKDKLEAAISTIAQREDIVKQAKKIVEQRSKATIDLSDLDLGGGDETSEAEAAADEGEAEGAEAA
jgi:hypothetical protein